ncbi:MAG: hypothetical protein HQ483_14490 [Rhodospirillales bacterium]|nr:hypothetical protein [Rhodospirillales bacterium]
MNSSSFSPSLASSIIVAGSITKLPPDVAGKVIISGSHGGTLPGALALRAGARAVVLNDAGVGRDDAGIGSLALCQQFAMAAAVVSHTSCRVGDAGDMVARGRISHANALAVACGVLIGQSCRAAAEALTHAPLPARREPPAFSELREVLEIEGGTRQLVLVDSASMVIPEDAGRVVLTGSHGGLIGGNPKFAIKAPVHAAFYNDAGFGIEDWGISRLPALEQQGIAGITLDHQSCRIGEARSGYATGIVSQVNTRAGKLGIAVGQTAADAVVRLCR